MKIILFDQSFNQTKSIMSITEPYYDFNDQHDIPISFFCFPNNCIFLSSCLYIFLTLSVNIVLTCLIANEPLENNSFIKFYIIFIVIVFVVIFNYFWFCRVDGFSHTYHICHVSDNHNVPYKKHLILGSMMILIFFKITISLILAQKFLFSDEFCTYCINNKNLPISCDHVTSDHQNIKISFSQNICLGFKIISIEGIVSFGILILFFSTIIISCCCMKLKKKRTLVINS